MLIKEFYLFTQYFECRLVGYYPKAFLFWSSSIAFLICLQWVQLHLLLDGNRQLTIKE